MFKKRTFFLMLNFAILFMSCPQETELEIASAQLVGEWVVTAEREVMQGDNPIARGNYIFLMNLQANGEAVLTVTDPRPITSSFYLNSPEPAQWSYQLDPEKMLFPTYSDRLADHPYFREQFEVLESSSNSHRWKFESFEPTLSGVDVHTVIFWELNRN